MLRQHRPSAAPVALGSASRFARISGLAALGFAFLIVAGNVVLVPAGLPRTGAGIGEVDEFFRAHGDLVGLGSALTPAAWILATLFGAGAVRVLWRSERDRGEAWALFGFAGLVLQNAVFAGVIAIRLALASTAADGIGADPGLWALHDALFTLNGTFLALALTGEQGLGHVVMKTPHVQEAVDFYCDILGFRLSDTADYPWGTFYFLGCNPRHHSVAFIRSYKNEGTHHILCEVTSPEEVGRALDRTREHDVELMATLGKHANDGMFSFYMKSPAGFGIEIGAGGVQVDESTWVSRTYTADIWGHHPVP
ncbi:VOC family protein [Streptomyces afghaniensis]|uniref:VOC family protein n=1 Tax=Streptomyces afghaniensis TaxID=66865 RepID=UPI00278837DB|nr:VOC family protein [Streptomyces afghaniensis]MDQ1022040.1 catechol 2,3-dioxygenase-like lactoylglutathione lyase family enzyme [Streptomyces afghaniensis]